MTSGIRCPICRSETGVTNTYQERDSIRRRRRCRAPGCPGWLITLELVHNAPPPDMVLVPRRMLRRLQNVVRAICFPTAAREKACASPEDLDTPVIE